VAKARKIDFSGVDKEIKKGGGAGKRIPEGDYVVKIVEGDWHKDEDKKVTGVKWVCQVVQGKHKGVKLRGFTSLKPDALWSLRNLIHAATGNNVAGKAVNLDIDKLVGKKVGAAVEDNEYTKNGKTKISSQINTFFPADEVGDTDEDEEDDDDETEDDEEEDEEDDEEDDLEDVEVEDL